MSRPVVSIDVRGVEKIKKLADLFPRETARALNDTVKDTKRRTVVEFTKAYNITRPNVERRGKFYMRFASPGRLIAEIVPPSKRMPIILFGGKKAGKRSKGASVEVIRGRKKVIPRSFVAVMPSGHKGIFRRTGEWAPAKRGPYAGRNREKIRELFTQSIANFTASRKIFQRVTKYAYKRLEERMAYRIGRAK